MDDEQPQEPDKKVALDQYEPLLRAWAEAKDNVKFWKSQEDKVKAALAQVMGDAVVGTLDGQDVVTFRPIESFNSGEFRKRYPDTYRTFTVEVTKREFDEGLLRFKRPDLWEEFQTRPMKTSYVVPDKTP